MILLHAPLTGSPGDRACRSIVRAVFRAASNPAGLPQIARPPHPPAIVRFALHDPAQETSRADQQNLAVLELD